MKRQFIVWVMCVFAGVFQASIADTAEDIRAVCPSESTTVGGGPRFYTTTPDVSWQSTASSAKLLGTFHGMTAVCFTGKTDVDGDGYVVKSSTGTVFVPMSHDWKYGTIVWMEKAPETVAGAYRQNGGYVFSRVDITRSLAPTSTLIRRLHQYASVAIASLPSDLEEAFVQWRAATSSITEAESMVVDGQSIMLLSGRDGYGTPFYGLCDGAVFRVSAPNVKGREPDGEIAAPCDAALPLVSIPKGNSLGAAFFVYDVENNRRLEGRPTERVRFGRPYSN